MIKILKTDFNEKNFEKNNVKKLFGTNVHFLTNKARQLFAENTSNRWPGISQTAAVFSAVLTQTAFELGIQLTVVHESPGILISLSTF